MKSEFIETIKVVDGIYFHMSYHQKRYSDVLKSFNSSDIKELSKYLDAPKKGIYRCRLTYNAQEVIDVEYFKYIKREIKSLKLIYNNIDYSFKYSNRDNIDELFAQRGGCDDILIVKNGLITDTSIANIAFFDGEWKTPKVPLLKGTTRARLLNEGKIVEADIEVDELKKYTKIALLNAMIDFDIIRQYNIKEIFC